MANYEEKSLIIRKETVYEKIRKSLVLLIFKKDFQMINELEALLKPKTTKITSETVIIPKEIGKDVKKY